MKTTVDIKIDQDRCKGCDLCLNVCPAKVFQESNEVGEKGFNLRIARQAGECSNCGLCKLFCPEGAILIEGRSRLDEFILHIQRNKEARKRGGGGERVNLCIQVGIS